MKQSGNISLEYAILIGIIAVIITAALVTFGEVVKDAVVALFCNALSATGHGATEIGGFSCPTE